jgi:acetoacetate decarboxylase
MKVDEVRKRAFAMPLTSPAFPPGPYKFVDREFFIVTYRTDPAALEEVVPEPLKIGEPLVKYEFIRMADSTGFGDFLTTKACLPRNEQGGSRQRDLYGLRALEGSVVVEGALCRGEARPHRSVTRRQPRLVHAVT